MYPQLPPLFGRRCQSLIEITCSNKRPWDNPLSGVVNVTPKDRSHAAVGCSGCIDTLASPSDKPTKNSILLPCSSSPMTYLSLLSTEPSGTLRIPFSLP